MALFGVLARFLFGDHPGWMRDFRANRVKIPHLFCNSCSFYAFFRSARAMLNFPEARHPVFEASENSIAQP